MVVAQYETLRRAVLSGALPPEASAGLVLFLRRGRCGWARAVATFWPRGTNYPFPTELVDTGN